MGLNFGLFRQKFGEKDLRCSVGAKSRTTMKTSNPIKFAVELSKLFVQETWKMHCNGGMMSDGIDR